MVGLFGLEPKTKGFIILCSNQLSYKSVASTDLSTKGTTLAKALLEIKPVNPDTGTGIIHNRCIVYNTGENKSDILKAYKVKKPSF